MNDIGWIKIHRKIEDWCWFDDPNTFVVFIHLLLLANIQDKNWQTIIIKRGSFVTSRIELAKRIGLSIQQTRTALDKLISTKEITKSTTSTYTVISINNYEKYQQVTRLATNEQPTDNQRVTTTKEYKNIRNKENNIYSNFSSLSLEVQQEIADFYSVSLESVKKLKDKLGLYCEANGKSYKNYKAALMNWVRTGIDKGEIKIIKQDKFYEELQKQKRSLESVAGSN